MMGAEAGGMGDGEAIGELLRGLEEAEGLIGKKMRVGRDVEERKEEGGGTGRGETDFGVSMMEVIGREGGWT